MSDREYTDCYLIRETEKARLFEIRDTKEQIWVPRSVIENMVSQAEPPELRNKLPGRPCVIRVASWFRDKNRHAFGD